MQYGFELAFIIVIGIIFFSETISSMTKGKVPGLFLMTVITLIGYWTILPLDVVPVSGMVAVKDITMMIILIHMGTLLEIDQLKREWRTVVTALAAVAGVVLVFMLLGSFVLPSANMAITAIAPLAGGMIAAILMSQALTNIGQTDLAVWPILLITLQGFIGMPVVAYMLRGEASDLAKKLRGGQEIVAHKLESQAAKKTKWIDKVPQKFRTPAFYFLILAILYTLNVALYNNVIVNIPYVKLVLDKSIVSLIIGVVLGNLGILDKGVMTKTKSEGIMEISFYAFIMTFLVGAKVETIKALIVPLLIAFVLATTAIAILSVLVGKRIGYSARLSMAVGFNCFLGFPLNYLITKEAAMAVAESAEEEEKIFDALLPTMLIAGFVCVTIVSVLVAGAMTSLVK
ncbi:hypothetical protein [Acidaminobacter sp.]|uniref:hypothetical protein n=1 Tax=Acidaminobacter sp. TaxID=1872102 RepID=UPI00137E4543|nr:hypothetical protein [Acidaminobacter sp.]MDK9710638.1 hypothetical protein [Acidaminobacter sp.]MZQ96375.1 hypothetical protein [Acidaminobacter sp.]